MKVILLQKVPGTGERGEVKEVASGYARNFLFPKKLARQATKSVLHDLESEMERETKKSEKELKDSQRLASKIDGSEIEISQKVSDGGRLYAAISADAVVKTIKKDLKVDVSVKQVKFRSPIKEPGRHEVSIEFGHGLEAEIGLIVSEE